VFQLIKKNRIFTNTPTTIGNVQLVLSLLSFVIAFAFAKAQKDTIIPDLTALINEGMKGNNTERKFNYFLNKFKRHEWKPEVIFHSIGKELKHQNKIEMMISESLIIS